MPSDNINLLIGKYVDGTITCAEAEQLLALVQSNPENRELLFRNSWCDFLFTEYSRTAEALQTALLMSAHLDVSSQKFRATDWKCADPFEWMESLPDREPIETTIFIPHCERTKRPWWKSFLHSNGSPKTDANSKRKKEKRPHNEDKVVSAGRYRDVPFIMSLCVFLLLIAGIVYESMNKAHRVDEQDFVGVARIAELVDVKWSDPTASFKRGQIVVPGQIKMDEGTVKLVFQSGATLLLEGRSEFVVTGSMSGFCNVGRISAGIPPSASGFEIKTRYGSVVDIGTAFYLDVGTEAMKVGVTDGKVNLYNNKRQWSRLETANACKLDVKQKMATVPFERELFLDESTFVARLKAFTNDQLERKKKMEAQWNRDPNLLLRYDFSIRDQTSIANSATRVDNQVGPARLSGVQYTNGPLYATNVVTVSNHESRIRTDIPGKYKSMTLVAAIRLDRLDPLGNVLFASDGCWKEPGSMLWQLHNGSLCLQITSNNTNRSGDQNFISEKVITPENLRTWSTFAVVLDAGKKSVTHYLDGRVISQNPWNTPALLVPGPAMIGNIDTDRSRTKRALYGAVDWFSVYDKALSSEEIGRLVMSNERGAQEK